MTTEQHSEPVGEEHNLRRSRPGSSLIGRRIGEVVVALGFASEKDVEAAVEEARESGRTTGRVLFDRGLLSKDQLARAIAARTQISYIDLRNLDIDERALTTIDANTATRYRAVPVSYVDDDTLLVAISEPSNVLAVDDIALMTGLSVRPALTTEEQLDELLSRLSRKEVQRVADASGAREAARQAGAEEADDRASANLLESVLTNALRQRASDIHLETLEDRSIRVRYRIDGITHESATIGATVASRLFARLKLKAGMNISQRHTPQDGRLKYGPEERSVTLRVATLPTIHGESAAIRILDQQNVPELKDLGLDPKGLDVLLRSLRKPHGAILATGPTGSGKTTTLYAALELLNTPERTIITVEDPVEYPLTGTRQVQVDTKRGLTFSAGLRTILRSDPDVVMVGEIRDHETAKIGVEAALTGRLVLSTLHTNDSASAVTRLTEMGVERYLVASSIECVVASRLARKLCVECRKPVTIDAAMLADAGFTGVSNVPFLAYEAGSCERCSNTGHRGRTGLFEVLQIDDRIREMLLERFPSKAIEQAAREQGMVTLAESGLQRVRDGVISIAEAIRVTAAE